MMRLKKTLEAGEEYTWGERETTGCREVRDLFWEEDKAKDDLFWVSLCYVVAAAASLLPPWTTCFSFYPYLFLPH